MKQRSGCVYLIGGAMARAVFSTGDGYIVALTYGPDADWVKNVVAAGGCELRTCGQAVRLGSPRIFHDEGRSGIGPVARPVLRILDVADFLSLTSAGARARAPGQTQA
jgi:hypothetical protein